MPPEIDENTTEGCGATLIFNVYGVPWTVPRLALEA